MCYISCSRRYLDFLKSTPLSPLSIHRPQPLLFLLLVCLILFPHLHHRLTLPLILLPLTPLPLLVFFPQKTFSC